MSDHSLAVPRARLHRLLEGLVVTEHDCGTPRDLGLEDRSLLACEAAEGVCASCFGADATTGKPPPVGFELGRWAADQLRDPAAALPVYRGFHVGMQGRPLPGSPLRASKAGVVKLQDAAWVTRRDGARVVVTRSGRAAIEEDAGVGDGEWLPYGCLLHVVEGERVEEGTALASWDPAVTPILCTTPGTVRLEDLEIGQGLVELRPPGAAPRVVVWRGGHQELKPRIVISAEGGPGQRLFLPDLAEIHVSNGQRVLPGDSLAVIPRLEPKTKHLPTRCEIIEAALEARDPGEPAVVSLIDGFVSVALEDGWYRRVRVEPEGGGEAQELVVPFDEALEVHDGDYVRAGDRLTYGEVAWRDLLTVRGEGAFVEHFSDILAECYEAEAPGSRPDRRSFELIAREMMGYLRVRHVGHSGYRAGQLVTRREVEALEPAREDLPPDEWGLPPEAEESGPKEPPVPRDGPRFDYALLGVSELLALRSEAGDP